MGRSKVTCIVPRSNEIRYDAVAQAGFEANPAPLSPPEGAGKKRGRPKQLPLVNMLTHLRDFTSEVVAFTPDFRGPLPTGKRDVRIVQVKQKVSGGFRTLEGARQCGRIRGYILHRPSAYQKCLCGHPGGL